MATTESETEVTIEWVPASAYRIVYPTGVLVEGMDVGEGQRIVIHFTTSWPAIRYESFPANVNVLTGSVKQKGQPQYTRAQTKILETSVSMMPDSAAFILLAMLQLIPSFSPGVQQTVRDAISRLPPPQG